MFEDFGGNKLIQDSGYLPSPFTVFQVVQVVEDIVGSMVCLPVQVLLVSVDPVTSYSSYLKLGRERLEAEFEVLKRSSIPKVTAIVKHLGMSILCLRQQQ